MTYIDEDQFNHWVKHSKVIEKDKHGLKVLALQDGTFLKLFRVKRLLSSQRLFPQSARFARNASKLQQRGILCPDIITTWALKNPPRNLVQYWPLQGTTLRDLCRNNPQQWHSLLPGLGSFVAHLHKLGIYFRSLHLGNIVLTPTGEFGLIDIADLHCKCGSLNRWQRSRNLRHLFRYTNDWKTLEAPHRESLIRGYAEVFEEAIRRKAISDC